MKKVKGYKRKGGKTLTALMVFTVLYMIPGGFYGTVEARASEHLKGPGVVSGVWKPQAYWQQVEGIWYFYQPVGEAEWEKAPGGWLWIDGYCYYFYPDGSMAANQVTPDGYQVSESGAWMEQGTAVWMPGKGILTKETESISIVRSGSVGSSSGSGFGGGSPGGSAGSGKSNFDDNPSDEDDIQEDDERERDEEANLTRLAQWEAKAREADMVITGWEKPDNKDYLVWDKESNDNRMKNMVSMISEGEPHTFYVIGRAYQPNTLIIAQTFFDQIIYSNTTVDSFYIHGVPYTISQIGIEKINGNESNDTENDIPAEGRYYAYGDTLTRTIGSQTYPFRCIDEDYRDSFGNYQQAALFLCDTVIGSDVDSDDINRRLLSFGQQNNYKQSKVRQWLNTNGTASLWQGNTVSIGIQTAYEGSTEAGTFEQLDGASLISYDIASQKIEDELFLLSVEEALLYAEELWRFQGSEENNPEIVYRPYVKGYYLRTPVYEEEDGEFYYGNEVYAVDLLGGNIRGVDVSYTTMGLRPAFVIPNG